MKGDADWEKEVTRDGTLVMKMSSVVLDCVLFCVEDVMCWDCRNDDCRNDKFYISGLSWPSP